MEFSPEALVSVMSAPVPGCYGQDPDVALAMRVRRAVNLHGEVKVAEIIGLSRAGLWRVAAAWPTRSHTADGVARRLEAAGL